MAKKRKVGESIWKTLHYEDGSPRGDWKQGPRYRDRMNPSRKTKRRSGYWDKRYPS